MNEQTRQAEPVEFRIGLIRKDNGQLSKTIRLGADGKPVSDASQCFIWEGVAACSTVKGITGLARHISNMKSSTALTLAPPAGVADGKSVKLVTETRLGTNPPAGTISRTGRFFRFDPGRAAAMLFDTDFKGIDARIKKKIVKAGGPWSAITQVMPGLAGAMRVRRLSTSAGLSANGVAFSDNGGEHNYIVVKDAADIPRATKTVHDRMTLAGYGWAYVSDGGAVLHWSPVDAVVGAPERLVFEGAPNVLPPLVQSARDAEAFDGEVIDTHAAIADLTSVERHKVEKVRRGWEETLADEARRVREARDRPIAEKRAKETGRPVDEITRELACRHSGRLPADQPLEFDDSGIGTKTVGDVLDDPETYIGKTLADPIEPEYGRCKAKVLKGRYGDIVINSFAHGGAFYVLTDFNRIFPDPIDEATIKRMIEVALERQAKRLRGRVRLDDLLGYAPSNTYIHRPTREMWPSTTVDKRLPKIGTGKLNSKNREIFMSPSTFIMRNSPVEQMTWMPGEPEILEDTVVHEGGLIRHAGMRVYNHYRPPVCEPGDPAKAERWREHVCKVFPAPGDAEHIELYLAHAVQKPSDKVNHSLLLGGEPGVGKDTVLHPVRYAVGEWNFAEVTPSVIFGRFNKFMKSVLLRINEVHDLGELSIYEFYERMKSLQISPPEMLRIDEKHLSEYHVPNVVHIVLTTNHKQNGLYLPADDRRHYVAWSPLKENEPGAAYFNDLYRWLEAEGNRHVAAYLKQRDISAFDAKAPPRKTAAFWEIANSNRSEGETGIGDLIEAFATANGGTPPDIFTLGDLLAVASKSNMRDIADWLQDRKHRRNIPANIEKNGYAAVANPDAKDGWWRIEGRRQAVYGRRDLPPKDAMRAIEKRTSRGHERSKSAFDTVDDEHDGDRDWPF